MLNLRDSLQNDQLPDVYESVPDGRIFTKSTFKRRNIKLNKFRTSNENNSFSNRSGGNNSRRNFDNNTTDELYRREMPKIGGSALEKKFSTNSRKL